MMERTATSGGVGARETNPSRCTGAHLQLPESLNALLAHTTGRLTVRLTAARGAHSSSVGH